MDDLLSELSELEHLGWRSLCDGTGHDVYGELMTAEARMVLANGVVMSRDDVVASLAHAPPWSDYTIDAPTATTIADDVACLVYTGTGHRDSGDDFTAIMTTVYVRHGSAWKLAHYQQTSAP
ncbi:DUF4440 domain-containing protein [Ilumatobacter nonamiensis]|uniref:DUF4440 domain-containing protein n=1 Tax=Ilumatobacter nonamiensis TaxID=467093 RepID=UPI0005900B06|nr:nuclear transport factor 2 family protein [Ilumatobacter nonamiensis]